MSAKDTGNAPQRETGPSGHRRPAVGVGLFIAGWLVPGLGHLLTGRWGRGVIFFLTVGALAVTGYLQRGFVFSPHFSDPFGLLGFLADAGAGVFYFAARWMEKAGPDISRAMGDYGTRFIATAGVVNVLSALDIFAIALRERN